MAQFKCADCGHEDHFAQFKSGSHEEHDEDSGESIEVDECECPECGSSDCYET